jgi:hypothetical protein
LRQNKTTTKVKKFHKKFRFGVTRLRLLVSSQCLEEEKISKQKTSHNGKARTFKRIEELEGNNEPTNHNHYYCVLFLFF